MTANDYQDFAHHFARYGTSAHYPYLGVAEEAGELVGKLAKFERKHGRFPTREDEEFVASVVAETGDVLWMAAEILTSVGVKLEDAMSANIRKLAERARTNTIVGAGDTVEERLANAAREAGHE